MVCGSDKTGEYVMKVVGTSGDVLRHPLNGSDCWRVGRRGVPIIGNPLIGRGDFTTVPTLLVRT